MYCEQENDWNINIRRSSNIYLIQDYSPPSKCEMGKW
jgi:hypothetical protein